ncbi:MAG: flagellar motor protein MotB [Planctomycetota bacterium]
MKAPPEPVIVKVVDEIVKKKGAPSYMVSFGDMMTLILCFFILLVSMAKERSFGMMAKGIGSFVVQLKSHGLTGIMDGAEKEEIFDQVRRRFNLPPESDPERRAPHDEASNHEMLRAQTLELLEPHRETGMPRVAAFEQGSARLTDATRHYLDQLVPSLFPAAANCWSWRVMRWTPEPIPPNANWPWPAPRPYATTSSTTTTSPPPASKLASGCRNCCRAGNTTAPSTPD